MIDSGYQERFGQEGKDVANVNCPSLPEEVKGMSPCMNNSSRPIGERGIKEMVSY
jgi:hypothetical protein